ncbi:MULTISPECIES: hypothetical protein [unclassified Clostridium]|uniref:hypothetical protein n=1 Tax=unclassified Clostridium TaxID=2614128 RepID=UPI000297727B|nr:MULTISPECIES: hypothetical protein [unclassified Clostridium]EKQ57964.1 MAG: hypothetical protein A370_00392 [Clostridium sp. Maddingley MBC34-26]
MKKFITVFFLSLFLFLNINSISSIAESKSFTQGLYYYKDTGLTTGSTYKIRNSSPTGKAVVIVFDGNQMMQEFIRLEPNSPDYIVKPLDFDSIIIIIGGGSVTFS